MSNGIKSGSAYWYQTLIQVTHDFVNLKIAGKPWKEKSHHGIKLRNLKNEKHDSTPFNILCTYACNIIQYTFIFIINIYDSNILKNIK